MKNFTTFLSISLIISCHSFLFSQNPVFERVQTAGGGQPDILRDMDIDLNDNVLLVGNFLDTIDLDPSPGVLEFISNGNYDSYIQKVDANGNLLWARSLGGPLDLIIKSVAADNLGNVLVVGNFSGTADFDPDAGVENRTSAGNNDIFVLKLDSDGNFMWAHNIGDTGNDRAYYVDTDDQNDVYVTGYFSNTVDFDPGAGTIYYTSNGNKDAFLLKLSTNGYFIWNRALGGTSPDIGHVVHVDEANNCYVTGIFKNTFDADPNAGVITFQSAGLNDIFIEKFAPNGTLIWALSQGGPGDDIVRAMDSDYLGNLYFTGAFSDTVDFDPGSGTTQLISNGETDIFIQKMNGNGDFMWATSMGDSLSDEGRAIVIDDSLHIYVAGNFYGSVDFDPSFGNTFHNSEGADDIFVAKYKSEGNYLWSGAMGGTSSDRAYAIGRDNNTNLYVGGYFTDAANFDPYSTQIMISNGSTDNFMVQFNQCNVDNSVMNIDDITLMAIADGMSYQWLDCNQNFAAISGETNQQFYGASNGSYAVEISNGLCVDTSECLFISTIGIAENMLEDLVKVYPNPSQRSFNVDLGANQEKVSISVLDLTGRIIFHEDYENISSANIDLIGAKGSYHMRVESPSTGTYQVQILTY